MNVYIIVILIYETFAYYEPSSDSPNVGTVLFKQSDLKKNYWSHDKIKLLQARKHLQELLPCPHHLKTVNEEYLSNLFSYFTESFKTVKREIKNPILNNMMNVALSDVLGGYLKLWVLPITKYAYYGGTVSMKKATNIFQIYEDIKTNLKTDGQGWRNPNNELLKSVAIEVASRPRSGVTRSMKDPCKSLAFYEKTDTDLTVPLPIIGWNILPVTLFVPLKNQTIVPISSPDSSKILLQYYDVAQNCMQVQSPTSVNDFNKKFQAWLSKDVTPHLSDDNLYIAFGSVLSLMNDTKKFNVLSTNNANKRYEKIKSKISCLGTQSCSKKYIILVFIILVEIIWCIPSVFYLVREKRKKQNRGFKKILKKLCKRKLKDGKNRDFLGNQNKKSKLIFDCHDERKNDCSVRLCVKPRSKNLDVDVQNPSCDCKYINRSFNRSYIPTDNQSDATPFPFKSKSSLEERLPELGSLHTSYSNKTCFKPEDNGILTRSKHSKLKKMISSKVIKAKQDHTIKEMNYSKENNIQKSNIELNSSPCVCGSNADFDAQNSLHDCTCFQSLCKVMSLNESKHKVLNKQLKSKRNKIKAKNSTETKAEKNDDPQISKNHHIDGNKIKTNKNSNNSSETPLLYVIIDKPQTEIQLGITRCREYIKSKPSKIPRLAVKRDEREGKHREEKQDAASSQTKKQTVNNLILRKKNIRKTERALDDIAIKRSSTSNNKLNLTL